MEKQPLCQHLESPIETQKNAELDQTEWRFTNPQRVASDALAKLLKIDESTIKKLRQTRQAQGRFVYQWKDKSKTEYMIVVSRPFSLLFFAKDLKQIVWIVSIAYKMT